MDRTFFIIGSILAGLAVLLGAFGAHGLRNLVAPELIATWEKGVRYQMYHALALLLLVVDVPFLQPIFNTTALGWAQWQYILPLIFIPALVADTSKPLLTRFLLR